MKNQLIIPSAEPFLYPGGRVGCLVVHGFTGTPKEMRPLGESLSKKGHTVLGIRLAGHATKPADMVRTRWQDWLASVEDGIHFLRSCTDYLFVLGLSMGGALTLLSAARYPVDGIVAMSTPISLPPDPRMRFLKILSLIQPEIEKGLPDWHDKENLTGQVSYPRYPTPSIIELNALLREMRTSLPLVTAPVLIMQSRNDKTIPPESMETIFTEIRSIDKEMIWLENSGHVITREPEKERVFQAAENFIKRVVSVNES